MCVCTCTCVFVCLSLEQHTRNGMSASREKWVAEGRGGEETDDYRSLRACCLECLSYPLFKIKCEQSMGRALKGIPGEESDGRDEWCAEGIAKEQGVGRGQETEPKGRSHAKRVWVSSRRPGEP